MMPAWMLWSALAAQAPCAFRRRVLDENGRPVPGAAVTALDSRGTTSGGATADAAGVFCIPQVAAGVYRLRAFSRIHAPSASPSCENCCAPRREFLPIETPPLPSGSRARDIVLRRAAAYCVRGEVRGRLPERMAIVLEQDGWSAAVLNEQGRFLLAGLTDGVYTLIVRSEPQLGRELVRRVIRVRGAHVTGVVVALPGYSSTPRRN